MNIGTVVVLLILVVVIGLAVRSCIKQKKNGGCSCSSGSKGGCNCCTHSSQREEEKGALK